MTDVVFDRLEARVRRACLSRAPGVTGEDVVRSPTSGHPGRSVVVDRHVESGNFWRQSPDDSWRLFVSCTSCRDVVRSPTSGHPGRSVVVDRHVESGNFWRQSPDDSWRLFVSCTSCRQETDGYLFRASPAESLDHLRSALRMALREMADRWGSGCYEALDLALARDVQES